MSIPELRSYGYRFPPLDERVTLLRETISVMKAMWTESEVSFNGQMIHLSHAVCEPKPIQKTGPPIWIGGRHRRLLDAAAEFADGWNHWEVQGEKLRKLATYLRSKCAEFHRPVGSVIESWAGTVGPLTNDNTLTENRVRELKSQHEENTRYFIASFPTNATKKTYESFAEAVSSPSWSETE